MSRKSSKRAQRVVRRTLKDGSTKTYRYAPYRQKSTGSRGDTVGDLIAAWQTSPEWRKLAESTKASYTTYIRHLGPLSSVPAAAVSRREMIEHRNAVAATRGLGAGTGFVRAASAMYGWAIEAGWMDHSPLTKVKRLPGGHLPAWTPQDAALAIAKLPEHLRRPVVLALYTGQRRGDLVRLAWSAYDGQRIRVKQQKTQKKTQALPMVIPCHPTLKSELDAWRETTQSTLILVNKFGRAWRPSNLSKQLGEALAKIEGFPAGRNIHGLRKLAAANMAQAGCTLHEIASITGHKSLGMLQLYTASVDQERLAEAAVVRLTIGKKE